MQAAIDQRCIQARAATKRAGGGEAAPRHVLREVQLAHAVGEHRGVAGRLEELANLELTQVGEEGRRDAAIARDQGLEIAGQVLICQPGDRVHIRHGNLERGRVCAVCITGSCDARAACHSAKRSFRQHRSHHRVGKAFHEARWARRASSAMHDGDRHMHLAERCQRQNERIGENLCDLACTERPVTTHRGGPVGPAHRATHPPGN